MTTYSTFVPGSGVGATVGTPGAGTSGHPSSYARKPYVIESLHDYSLQNVATGDIFNCFNIPIGSVVLAVGAHVITGCNGTSPTVKLGHTDDDDEWFAATACATDNTYIPVIGDGTAAAVQLNVIAASKKIIATFSVTGTISVGIIRYWMLIVDVSPVKVTSTTAPNAS